MMAITPSWSGEIAYWKVFCNAARSEIDPARLRDSVAAVLCPIPLILESWRHTDIPVLISDRAPYERS
jgi:hypothetical protein